MSLIPIPAKALDDFCTALPKHQFKADLQGNFQYKIIEERIGYFAPSLYFDSQEIFNRGTDFGVDTSVHGPFNTWNKTRKDTFVAHLSNATIIPKVFCILNDQQEIVFPNSYSDSSLATLDFYSERSPMMGMYRKIYSKARVEIQHLLETDFDTIRVEEPCVLLSSQSSSNIYHWLIESVPRLWILEEWPEFRDLKFIVHDTNDPKINLLIEKFGINRQNLVVLNNELKYQFAHLIYPSALGDLLNIPKKTNFLRKLFGLPPMDQAVRSAKPNRYFLTRRDTPLGRGIINEKELVETLKPFGVQELVMSDYSFDQLAQIFSQSDLIIGAMGSGLLNMIFLPPESHIIELTPRFWDGFFWEMGCGCRHFYHVQASICDQHFTQINRPFVFGMPDAMEFDLEILRSIVSRI